MRGSIACPTPRHVGFGGNTSCLEVTAGDTRVILDAGTGIRELGRAFIDNDVKEATLLLTHTHWDHINGFPFFRPVFQEGFKLTVIAAHLTNAGGVRAALEGQMAQPMFSVPLEYLPATLEFEDREPGEAFQLGPELAVKTAALNHPNGATGYRLEYQGASICYITDTEHVPGAPDETILGLIEGADLVVYDCTYTDEEFPDHVGWGHSTWQEGVRLARQAGAKRLAIFHHDPDHDDDFMASVEVEAKQIWERAFVAREGMTVRLG